MSMGAFVLVLGVVMMGAASPASAAPGWTEPAPLPFPGGLTVAVAFADGGVQFTARTEADMPIDPNAVSTRLVVSRKAPGGPWTDDLVITSTPTAVPVDAVLAVAPNGAACLVWTEGVSNDFMPAPPFRWRAAYRADSGAWETPVTLFTDLVPAPSGSGFANPFCAIAPDGTAIAGASHLEPDDAPEPGAGQTDAKIDASIRPAGGTWQPAETLSPPNQSVESDVGLVADAAGNFTMAWRSRFSEGGTPNTTDDRHTILVRRRLAGQSLWNAVEDITGSNITKNAFFGSRGLAVGPSGAAVIGFQYPDPDGDSNAFAAVRQDSLHTFGAPEQIADSTATSSARAVAVGPDGTAYVLYWFQGSNSGLDHFGLVRRPPGGSWTPEAPVSLLGYDGTSGGIAFVGTDAFAVWEAREDVDAVRLVQASRWPASAPAPEGFRDLAQRTEGVSIEQVVSDRAGSIVAVWTAGTVLEAAAFDAGGPLLTASSVPSGIVAGVPATFGATFVDLWSALAGPPSWDFADGTPAATGDSVTHVFPTSGTFAVTVTAADALGNARTETLPVSVAECEALAGLAALACRCDVGLAISSCAGQSVPEGAAKRFAAACTAVDAIEAAGAGKKARKAAGRAAKQFSKARRAIAGKAGKALPAGCRDALAALLDVVRQNATALKGTLR